MSPLCFLAVVFAALVINGLCFVNGQEAWPGTPCPTGSSDTECASKTTLLICGLDGECACISPQVFVYDLKQCRLPVNAACQLPSRSAELVSNAVCVNAIVECKDTYDVTPTLGCAHAIGGKCSSVKDCDQDNFVDCLTETPKVCACTAGFLEETGTCKLDYGSECKPDLVTPGPLVPKCPADSSCDQVGSTSTFLCSGCPSDLVQDPTGKCVVPYDGECTTNPDFTRPCDETAYLECDNTQYPNVCKCQNPESTWFDSVSCKLLIGEPCSQLIPCSGVPCVLGGLCSCPAGKVPDVAKHQCVSSYLGDCATDSDCSAAEFLVCGTDNKCQCENNAWYNNGRCELLLGEPCAAGRYCIGTGDCGTSAEPCSCGSNADEGADRHTCIRHLGADCDDVEGRPCDDAANLVCGTDKKCACPAYTWYVNDQCELEIGQPCAEGKVCIGTGDCGSSIDPCTCGENAEASNSHTCLRHQGADCNDNEGRSCNNAEYLECSAADTCECTPNSRYNPLSRMCELLVGEYCSPGSNSQPCTEFSMCSSQNQTCVCLPGYTPALNGTCILVDESGEPSFGAPCEHVNDCSREDYLECGPDKTCECHFDSWFNPSSKKCELLVRSPCIPDSFAQACTEYADCTYNSNAGYICLCSEDGFVASKDKRCVHQTCVGNNRKLESFLMPNSHHKNGSDDLRAKQLEPLYGTPCDHANDCSREDYLECGPDKTCECHFDSWFNPKSEKCELLVRSPCIPDSFAQACTEYSECTYNTNAGFICLCNEDGFVGSADKRCVHQSCAGHKRKLESFHMLNNKH